MLTVGMDVHQRSSTICVLDRLGDSVAPPARAFGKRKPGPHAVNASMAVVWFDLPVDPFPVPTGPIRSLSRSVERVSAKQNP